MKKLIAFFTLLFICCLATAYGFNICKTTKNGKTIVGFKEDWTNSNSQIRVEPKNQGNYGYTCVGFDDNLIQGAINEAAFMFDTFDMPNKAIQDTTKKRVMGDEEAIDTIMKTFSTLSPVRDYLAATDLSLYNKENVIFANKTGAYLPVESDEMFIEKDAVQTFSNFIPL